MKKFLAILLVATALAGCRTRFDVTLTSGMKITNVSRPKLEPQSNFYYFKDAAGQMHSMPASRVSVIEPTGSSDEPRFGETKTRKRKR